MNESFANNANSIFVTRTQVRRVWSGWRIFAMLCLYVRYWLWLLASKGILGFIYLAVISEGLRVLVPALGQKLYKLPFLSQLKDYELTYRLDLAPFFAMFLLVAVFVLWPLIIGVWMRNRDIREWSQEQKLVVALGSAILFADAVLFYYAMTQMTWGESSISFAGLVATTAYVGVLIFVSWATVKLNPNRKEI